MNVWRSRRTKKTDQAIVGYRVWRVAEGYLHSCAYMFMWPHRKPMVRDEIQNEGIHAVKDAAALPSLFAQYHADAAGAVSLWGECIEHTEGWLAEFAYPKYLWMPESTDPMTVMQIEDNYGVPVTLRNDFVRYTINQILYPNRVYSQAPGWNYPTIINPFGGATLSAYGLSPQNAQEMFQQQLLNSAINMAAMDICKYSSLTNTGSQQNAIVPANGANPLDGIQGLGQK